MKRLRWLPFVVAGVLIPRAMASESVQTPRSHPGRALAIEDYYRIQSVGGVQMSPDGKWVLFTITTRIEETNGNKTEVAIVPSDASAPSRRVQHDGKDVTGAGWTPDNLLR